MDLSLKQLQKQTKRAIQSSVSSLVAIITITTRTKWSQSKPYFVKKGNNISIHTVHRDIRR